MATVAHYNLLDLLGEGALGQTYRARDTRVGRTVALKVIAAPVAADPARLARLMEDARPAMGLSHPNIATLFDAGEEEGRAYLAYEFAAGRTLHDELAGAAMNPKRALDLAIQLADGVADAHAHDVIHGDLRPGSVIVTAKGGAKILDFGLAPWTRAGMIRAQASRDPDALPQDSNPIVSYLSPEQAFGSATDVRTDVFSLAVITYEMLSGRPLFTGGTPAETVINVIQRPVIPPSQVSAGVPAGVDAVLGRALARNLEERLPSAAMFAAELRAAAASLSASGPEAPPSILLPLDERPDKEASGLLYGALTAAAAAAGLVWWWLSRG